MAASPRQIEFKLHSAVSGESVTSSVLHSKHEIDPVTGDSQDAESRNLEPGFFTKPEVSRYLNRVIFMQEETVEEAKVYDTTGATYVNLACKPMNARGARKLKNGAKECAPGRHDDTRTRGGRANKQRVKAPKSTCGAAKLGRRARPWATRSIFYKGHCEI